MSETDDTAPQTSADVIEAAAREIWCHVSGMSMDDARLLTKRALKAAHLLADPSDRDADECSKCGCPNKCAEAEVARLKADRCTHNKCPGGSLCCCQPNEAEVTELRTTIERVRALADEWDARWDSPIGEGKPMTTAELRVALDDGESL